MFREKKSDHLHRRILSVVSVSVGGITLNQKNESVGRRISIFSKMRGLINEEYLIVQYFDKEIKKIVPVDTDEAWSELDDVDSDWIDWRTVTDVKSDLPVISDTVNEFKQSLVISSPYFLKDLFYTSLSNSMLKRVRM